MNTIQLLMKANQLIDELAWTGPSTPAELAKAVSEPRSSVYRIVAALEQTNLVRQFGGGRLELGTAILHLGDAAADALVGREVLRLWLDWLCEELGVSAYFCVLRRHGAVCLDRVGGCGPAGPR